MPSSSCALSSPQLDGCMDMLVAAPLRHALQVYPSCRLAADLCNNASWLPGICALADTWCTATQYTPVTWAAGPDFNVYNIRAGCPQPPLCYDFLSLELYLNLPQTQAALGVHRRSAQALRAHNG